MRKRFKQLQRAIEAMESRLLFNTIYVDANAPGATHNGSSWATAYLDMQQALSVASGATNDQILVADGTYKPTITTDRTATFQLKTGVSLMGGYAGASDPSAQRNIGLYLTVLSGDLGTLEDSSDNSYHVITGSGTDASARLDGFIITAGYANGENNFNIGAGMYNDGGNPSVFNCRFIANTASSAGGAVINRSSAPAFTNCIFIANTSGDSGGAININDHENVSSVITNCTFVLNSAGTGGAIEDAGSVNLKNCILWGNTAPTQPQLGGSGSLSQVSNSDIQGSAGANGNLDTDPLFVRLPSPGLDEVWGTSDDDWGDLRLQPYSPCVDAGSNAFVPSGVVADAGSGDRFLDVPTAPDVGTGPGFIVDMGGFETAAALVAGAGGPYAVVQGQDVSLHGYGASTAAGAIDFAWDWTGDGIIDSSDPNPLMPASALPAGSITTITLRITDANFQSVTTTTTLRILPQIMYVDSKAIGAGNGTSWTDAVPSLAAALKSALPGMTLRVAGGTYLPTASHNRSASFTLVSGVALYGGYAGANTSNPDARDSSQYPTVLSGDIGVHGNASDNCFHVVYAFAVQSPAALDGFTLSGGNADGENLEANWEGGGLYLRDSSLTINNCKFTDNKAIAGAGVYMQFYTSTPAAITNCTISDNTSTSAGGGLYIFNGTVAVTNCTITRNAAAAAGGGFYGFLSTSTFNNCKIDLNTATNNGGGIYLEGSQDRFINCSINGNSAEAGGGVFAQTSIFSATSRLINCLMVGNTAGFGGGFYGSGSGNIFTNVINCSISANTALYDGGGLYGAATVKNSIVWDNAGPNGPQISGNSAVTFSDVQDGRSGTGNINVDPQFVRNSSAGSDGVWGTSDDDYGDLRLRATSACIDVASNAAQGSLTDFAGNNRRIDTPSIHDPGAIVDMGAYEYQSPLAASGGMYLFSASRPTVKINFNGDVNSGTLQAADLVLYNQTTGQTIDTTNLATVVYDPGTRSATWKFNTSLLPDGNYHATLASGSCSDTLGNPLGSAYGFDIFVLAGDANHDGIVNVADLYALAQNWQGNSKVFSQGDFNYDTKVDLADVQMLAANWNKTPSGAALGPMIPMPSILPLSPPPPPPPPAPVVGTLTTATKRTAPKLVSQVL